MSAKKKEVKSKKKAQTKLATIMFENKIKLEQLSEESGVSMSIISNIKTGNKVNPELNTLRNIQNALAKLTGQEIKLDDII
jgi:predicted transcriptional regulator